MSVPAEDAGSFSHGVARATEPALEAKRSQDGEANRTEPVPEEPDYSIRRFREGLP
jgi:hypothetical protein